MRKPQSGFTLMEMIGVIAVIAILASMATPLIFDAIRNARITAFLEDVNVVRTAVARYYEDTGEFPEHIPSSSTDGRRQLMANSVTSPIPGWNGPYIETELENPFEDGAYAAVRNSGGSNYQFDLDGDGVFDTSNVVVLEVHNLTEIEARKISDILDGDGDVATGTSAWYAAGRAKTFGGAQGESRMLIYLSRE